MTITEQIKALPTGRTVIHNLDVNAMSAEFDHSDLIALAESHERLLTESRRALISLAGISSAVDPRAEERYDNLKAAIEEAEKI